MKLKLTKPLIFVSGVTFGILVTIFRLYYDVLSRQPQPKIVKHNLVVSYVDDNLYDMSPAEVKDFLEGMDLPVMIDALRGRVYVSDDEDTQPVKVEDEPGAWQLDQWAKEAE